MLTAVLTLFANIHIYKARKKIKSSYLDSYIEACCVWMLILFAMTEWLSVIHAVRFIALFGIWVMLDLVLIAALAVQVKTAGYKIGKLYGKYKKELTWREFPYYGILFLIGVIVLVLAVCTTPYNWDSMTYHLPRIAHWVQNRSVEHYATNDIRQIASPVLGEFVNLHVYVLCSGRDILLNMVQTSSYVTCAFLVGAIAGKLGCDRLFKFLAVLIYMSMPIAFAEALTTQVDNFATVWLLFYVYVLLDLVKAKKMECKSDEIGKVSTMGMCVAWGYLAKPSVLLPWLFLLYGFWADVLSERIRCGTCFRWYSALYRILRCRLLRSFSEILRLFMHMPVNIPVQGSW